MTMGLRKFATDVGCLTWAALLLVASGHIGAQPSVVCKTSADRKTTECVPRGTSDPVVPQRVTQAAKPVQLYLARLDVPRDPRSRMGNLGQMLGQAPAGSVSLATLEQSLALDRQQGDLKAQVADLVLIASVHIRGGNYRPARQRLDEAQDIAVKLGQPDAQGAVLNNLGVLLALQGDYPSAILQTEQARRRYDVEAETAKQRQQPSRPNMRGSIADALASVLGGQGGAFLANPLQAQAAAMGREITRLNLGAIYSVMGRFEDASAQYDQALLLYGASSPAGAPAEGSGSVLLAKVNMLRMAGKHDEAEQTERRAGAAGESLTSRMAFTGDAPIELRSPSAVAADMPRRPGMPVLEPDSTDLSRTAATTQLAVYQSNAAKHAAAGNLEASNAAWRQAAAMAEILGAASAVSGALSELQGASLLQGNMELSIYYGKRTVNELQGQRARMGALGRDDRNAFAARARRVYESLALVLMDTERLSEAEQALKLLREDASSDFVRIEGRMPYSLAETALLSADRAQVARWRANVDARSALRGSPGGQVMFASEAEADGVLNARIDLLDQLLTSAERATGNPNAVAQAMLMLQQHLDDLNNAGRCSSTGPNPRIQQLSERLKKLQQTVPSAPRGSSAMPNPGLARFPVPTSGMTEIDASWCNQREGVSISEQVAVVQPALARGLKGTRPAFSDGDAQLLNAGQQIVASAPAGTVALQYLTTPKRLRMLLIGPRSRVTREVAVERTQLDAMADSLRKALQDQGTDPKRQALELYRVLIAPVREDLQRLDAKTLLLSLDGRMRYVPFAALHTGDRWLAEVYATTLGGPTKPRASRPRREWQVAGFGATGGAGSGLQTLDAVDREIRYVVKDRNTGTGVLPGVILVNPDFTASALRATLAKRYSVVHIASHFVLNEEDREESYLLLGDGSRLNLKALREGYRFDGVDLLTLSACDTGQDMRNSWGQEFEGLSNLLRGQGASSVLATLWRAVDVTTPMFMKAFYEGLMGSDAVTKAQAIRAVQASVIDGRLSALAALPAQASSQTRSGGFGAPPSAAPVAVSLGYAHPYFWAPFVLMGDWQ